MGSSFWRAVKCARSSVTAKGTDPLSALRQRSVSAEEMTLSRDPFGVFRA
jgi:hypothetical protein